MTIYECLTCRECYPKEKFKFSWKIAEYVVEGNWVEKSEDMSVCEYSIIEKSWGQEAILRLEDSRNNQRIGERFRKELCLIYKQNL